MLIKRGLIDWELGNFAPLKRVCMTKWCECQGASLGSPWALWPGWMRCEEDVVCQIGRKRTWTLLAFGGPGQRVDEQT